MTNRYGRSITIDTIGAIGDIIKNLIKIDTEERVEKSKESVRDYYNQRQELNRRIARNQRRRTELLSQSRSTTRETDTGSSNFLNESNETGKISQNTSENHIEDDGSETKSEIIKFEDASLTKDGKLSSFQEDETDEKCIRSQEFVDEEIETTCSFCARVEDITGETMMLYRIPQHVKKAKTELSLKLRKSSNDVGATILSEWSTNQKNTDFNDKLGKEKCNKRQDSINENRAHKIENDAKPKSKQKHENSDRKSTTIQQPKNTEPRSVDDRRQSRKPSKPIEVSDTNHNDEKEAIKRKPSESRLECTKRKSSKSKPNDLNEDRTFLMQRSRGIKLQNDNSIQPNEILNAKSKLIKKDTTVKNRDSEEFEAELAKIRRKISQKEKSGRSGPTEFENTFKRILHAKEKIRNEFGNSDSDEDRERNRPMMRLINLPESSSDEFEKRPKTKPKRKYMVVEGITTEEEVYALTDDKSRKLTETESSTSESVSTTQNKLAKPRKSIFNKETNPSRKQSACNNEKERFENKTVNGEDLEKYQLDLRMIGYKLSKTKAVDETMLETLVHGMVQKTDNISEDKSRKNVRRKNAICIEKVSNGAKYGQNFEQSSAPKFPNQSDAVFVRRKSPVRKPSTMVVSDKTSKMEKLNIENPFQVKLRTTGSFRRGRRSHTVDSSSIRNRYKFWSPTDNSLRYF